MLESALTRWGGAPTASWLWWRDESRHFADHGEDEALVAVRQRGAEALISPRKRIFVLREFAEHFLRLAVARRFCAGKKSASEMSMASAIFASVSSDGTVWPFSTRER